MLTTLPPSCAVVMKSGKFNFLEPSGPLQACNGTALPAFNATCRCLKIRATGLVKLSEYRGNACVLQKDIPKGHNLILDIPMC